MKIYFLQTLKRLKRLKNNSEIQFYYVRNQGEGGGRPSLTFFENREKCPDFGKKDPDCAHLWVKFPIQNVA